MRLNFNGKYRLLSLGLEPVSLGLAPGRCLYHKLQEVTDAVNLTEFLQPIGVSF